MTFGFIFSEAKILDKNDETWLPCLILRITHKCKKTQDDPG